MIRKQFDYEAELKRPMCQGCDKLYAGGRVLTGWICTMYAARMAPKMMREANECPHNYRRRKAGGKVRVGQGKGRSGGNL